MSEITATSWYDANQKDSAGEPRRAAEDERPDREGERKAEAVDRLDLKWSQRI